MQQSTTVLKKNRQKQNKTPNATQTNQTNQNMSERKVSAVTRQVLTVTGAGRTPGEPSGRPFA